MPVTEAKEAYAARLNSLLDTYDKVLFCELDNVRSQQLHHVRRALRGHGELIVGKKTLQKRIIANRAESEGASSMDRLLKEKLVTEEMLVGNLGLLFTNEDVASMEQLLHEHRVQAPARVGAIAPCEVTVPAGNTGLEPTMTSFFQALNIATKISKGMVEIVADKKVLSPGDKVDNSVSALLQKLKISPFFYAVKIAFFWEKGLMFTAEDLAVTNVKMEEEMTNAINSLTAVSLATGILTETSFPHAIMDGFKNLLAASVETDYEFEEFNGKQLRQDIKEGKAVGAAPAAAADSGAAAAAPAPAQVDEEEEDEDFGMGGLF